MNVLLKHGFVVRTGTYARALFHTLSNFAKLSQSNESLDLQSISAALPKSHAFASYSPAGSRSVGLECKDIIVSLISTIIY